MKQTLGYTIFVMFLLSACTPGATATPGALVQPPLAATPSLPLPTLAAATGTAMPPPALTLPATDLPRSLTQAAAAQLCDLGASRLNDWDRTFSPAGPWAAVVCEGDPLITRVYRMDSSIAWRLPAYTLDFTTASERPMLLPFHWSPDGRYLYLAASICCQAQAATGFEDGYALMRLDLGSGVLVPVLSPYRQRDGYALSFSPGDRYLTYVGPGEIALVHFVNLLTGTDDVIHLKARYWDAGRFSWSPDGSKVMITAAMAGWATGEGGFSLLLYDLPNQKLHLLVDNDLRQPVPSAPVWLNDDAVALESLTTGEKLQLKVSTREITSPAQ